MLPLKFIWAILFIAVIGAGCKRGTQSADNSGLSEFPVISEIPDENRDVRKAVTVKVPTKLAIQRTTESLSIAIDRDLLESTIVMIGTKMMTGVQSKLFVFAEGDARPSEPSREGFSSGLDFYMGTSTLNAKQEGIPATGKNYVVEMELIIFETDVPPQHLWSPETKNYKILWKRTLKETVNQHEEAEQDVPPNAR